MNNKHDRFELGLPIGADQPEEKRKTTEQKPYQPLFEHEQSLLTPQERARYKKEEDKVLKPWLDRNSGLGRKSWNLAAGFTFLAVYLKQVLANRELVLTKDYVDKTAPSVLYLVQHSLDSIDADKITNPIDKLNDVAEIVKEEIQRRIEIGEIEV